MGFGCKEKSKTTFSAGLQHHSAGAGCGAQVEIEHSQKKSTGIKIIIIILVIIFCLTWALDLTSNSRPGVHFDIAVSDQDQCSGVRTR